MEREKSRIENEGKGEGRGGGAGGGSRGKERRSVVGSKRMDGSVELEIRRWGKKVQRSRNLFRCLMS